MWITDGQWFDQSLFPAPLLHDYISMESYFDKVHNLRCYKECMTTVSYPILLIYGIMCLQNVFIGLIIYMASREESIGVLQL